MKCLLHRWMSQVAEWFIDPARTLKTVAHISLQADARVQKVCLELVPRFDASVPGDAPEHHCAQPRAL